MPTRLIQAPLSLPERVLRAWRRYTIRNCIHAAASEFVPRQNLCTLLAFIHVLLHAFTLLGKVERALMPRCLSRWRSSFAAFGVSIVAVLKAWHSCKQQRSSLALRSRSWRCLCGQILHRDLAACCSVGRQVGHTTLQQLHTCRPSVPRPTALWIWRTLFSCCFLRSQNSAAYDFGDGGNNSVASV